MGQRLRARRTVRRYQTGRAGSSSPGSSSSPSGSSSTGCCEELEPALEAGRLPAAAEAPPQERAVGPSLRGRKQRLRPSRDDDDPGVDRRPRAKDGGGQLPDEPDLPPRRPPETEQCLGASPLARHLPLHDQRRALERAPWVVEQQPEEPRRLVERDVRDRAEREAAGAAVRTRPLPRRERTRAARSARGDGPRAASRSRGR